MCFCMYITISMHITIYREAPGCLSAAANSVLQLEAVHKRQARYFVPLCHKHLEAILRHHVLNTRSNYFFKRRWLQHRLRVHHTQRFPISQEPLMPRSLTRLNDFILFHLCDCDGRESFLPLYAEKNHWDGFLFSFWHVACWLCCCKEDFVCW